MIKYIWRDKMELVIKKCNKCGALVKIINDCNCDGCGIKCCGEEMKVMKPNSTDASFEKHLPTYEIVSDKLEVTVNHVMDDDHYIEWVCLVNKDREEFVYFKPGSSAKATFENKKGILYAYCNKHGLWEKEVK